MRSYAYGFVMSPHKEVSPKFCIHGVDELDALIISRAVAAEAEIGVDNVLDAAAVDRGQCPRLH